MGPSELIISGLLTTALVAPASLLIESAHPGFAKYVMRNDCKVGQMVTSCIVNSETGEQLGI